MPGDRDQVAQEGEHQKEKVLPRAPSASDGFRIPVLVHAGSLDSNLLVFTVRQTLCGERKDHHREWFVYREIPIFLALPYS